MKRFKDAARAAYRSTYAGQGTDEGHVERLSIDVDTGGQREIVSLRLSGDRLLWSCTCGELECKHARTALAFLVDAEAEGESATRITAVYEPSPVAGADVRTVDESDQAARADTAGLRRILTDVVTAVVRSGVAGGASPSIDEALQRLVEAAPSPLPLGISRWIGRLRGALETKDVESTARILDGATRVIEDLAEGTPGEDARRRIVSWLGALTHEAGAAERVSDRTMVELAREWLPGVRRAGVERRYLIDLGNGEVYREERSGGAQTASLGSCPRVIHVGLASIERGAGPRRIRLLQYATTPVVDDASWDRVSEWATRSFLPLATRYRDAIDAYPGLAEPFALVAPDSVNGEEQPVLMDDAGHPLPCTGEPAALRYLEERTAGSQQPLWITGRLVDPGGVLAIVPLSAAIGRRGQVCYTQI